MPIIYNKLFHILIDRGIKKGELQKKANITASIMARLAKNEPVKMDTIEKICEALQCQPGDVLQYVKITELKNSNGKLDEDILVETPFLDEDSSMEIQERSNYLKNGKVD